MVVKTLEEGLKPLHEEAEAETATVPLEVSEAVAKRVLYLAKHTRQTVDELIGTFVEGFPYRETEE